jgi:hypothetical protein
MLLAFCCFLGVPERVFSEKWLREAHKRGRLNDVFWAISTRWPSRRKSNAQSGFSQEMDRKSARVLNGLKEQRRYMYG